MRLALLALLLAPPAGAQDASAPPAEDTPPPAADTPPEDTEVVAARTAYNEGHHNEAARLFLRAVQAAPRRADLYRDLARARLWADDPVGAVIAYRFYLELAPAADDAAKVTAERDLALKKLLEPPPPGPPAESARLLDMAGVRAADGRFAGEDGALGAVRASMAKGYIGPGLADALDAVGAALMAQSDAGIDRWWRAEAFVEARTLAALSAGWADLRALRPLTPPQAGRAASLTGLSRLKAGDPEGAVNALAPVAAADSRLRYAQALGLVGAERLEEADQVLTALAPAAHDPRVHLLLGLVRARRGADGTAALRRGLGLN